ncbi:HK97 family phage prohead protease [uncultured Novosphingobium sp.]|uniref:HK97 family phage prohead protease n=1 Tax=uncultured Novosphingobium sp. TaxID=292277 RepID=UPI003749DB08
MSAAASLERRTFSEVRTAGRRLEGYAATFGSKAALGSIVETIKPGAFGPALAGDVLALLDHDASKVLGRTRSGSLRLAEDAKGLTFSLDLPDTQAGRDVLALAERGDLGGMSFGFMVPKGGEEWDGDNRTLLKVDLKEISVVSAWPAYPDTTLALRSRQQARSARVELLREITLAELRA